MCFRRQTVRGYVIAVCHGGGVLARWLHRSVSAAIRRGGITESLRRVGTVLQTVCNFGGVPHRRQNGVASWLQRFLAFAFCKRSVISACRRQSVTAAIRRSPAPAVRRSGAPAVCLRRFPPVRLSRTGVIPFRAAVGGTGGKSSVGVFRLLLGGVSSLRPSCFALSPAAKCHFLTTSPPVRGHRLTLCRPTDGFSPSVARGRGGLRFRRQLGTTGGGWTV